MMEDHNRFMQLALDQARIALSQSEVPVGAVVVHQGDVIGQAHNLRESLQDPLAHAEMLAIRQAAQTIKSWRLLDAVLYVTVEPCPMCAGAIYQARIKKLVYGIADPKAGAAGSLMNITQDERLNHRVEVVSGVCADKCRQIMQEFFKKRRLPGD